MYEFAMIIIRWLFFILFAATIIGIVMVAGGTASAVGFPIQLPLF